MTCDSAVLQAFDLRLNAIERQPGDAKALIKRGDEREKVGSQIFLDSDYSSAVGNGNLTLTAGSGVTHDVCRW